MIANLQWALQYARRGWHVFPVHEMNGPGACSCGKACSTPGKHPRTQHGFKDATRDEAAITTWWTQWPNANIGIATGPSDLLVLDVDPKNGGTTSLEALLKQLGDAVMDTVRCKTGGDGLHVYYARGGRDITISAGKLGAGLDIRANGGYVVAPPSNHASGNSYAWVPGHFPDTKLQDAPAALVEQLQREKPAPVAHTEPQPVVSGNRNHQLTSLAGSLQRKGFTTDAIAAALKAHNRAVCKPPLSDQEVDHIVRSVSRYPKGPAPDALVTEPLTEFGNSKRLIATFGDLFRFVPEWDWVIWDGRRWERNPIGMEDFAKKTVHITQATAIQVADDEHRKRLLKWCDRSQTWNQVTKMINLARSDMRKPAADFDQHEALLNVRNGVLDLTTGKLQPHAPELYITQVVDIDYNPNATCPRWEKFLEQCCLGDAELMAFLQRAVGYTLTGYTNAQVLFFLFGDGENGKSVFIETVRHLLGDLAGSLSFNTLLDGRDSKPQHDLAALHGKRMATAMEAGEGRSLAENVIKEITGQDTINVRRLYEDGVDMRIQFKIWLSSNYKPAIRGTDNGIWRRFLLVPFQNHLKAGERDSKLQEKLRAELPGILAWAVRGAQGWHQRGGGLNGLAPPKKVLEAVQEYKEDNDVVGRWIDERCTLQPDLVTPAGDLLQAINAYLVDMHEREMTQNALSRRLTKFRGGLLRREKNTKTGIIEYHGIAPGRNIPPPVQRSLHEPPAQQASSVEMPEAHRKVLDIIRQEVRNGTTGHVTDTLIEQIAALQGIPPKQVQEILVRLRERGKIYQRLGPGTYAPMEA